ncbi:MFS transporter [Amycolatopsis thermophila]|uniref:MFS family permease n=1 Tax=Amycolatopsis thermophila TaxID=206084 RepID=A0ABU0EPR6_9PSEU|nr:MFS transporter [Amycolatopsis thermophila]MDQ0377001.1 MFS family permease [Amycolatopsis thermophila]
MSVSRSLALAQLVNSLGDGAYYVTSALYFTLVAGLSPAQVGLGLTVGWAVGAVGGVVAGHLADRCGPRRVAVVLALATAAALGAFPVATGFPAFLALATSYACGQSGLAAARQALLAGLVEPARRTRVRAHLQAATNAGLAVGAALGGLALQAGTPAAYQTVFAADAAGFVLAALILSRVPEAPAVPAPDGPRLAVLRDRPYAVLALLNTIMLLNMPLLSLVIPLWMVQRTDAPAWLVSALLVVNTVSVVLFQVRVARRVTGVRTAARAARRAGILMLLACAVYALSAGSSGAPATGVVLLVAAGIQVAGEMLAAAGAWELGFALAPDDKQGQYQGFFASGVAVARTIGPLLLTTLVLDGGVAGWLVLGALFLFTGSAFVPVTRWAGARETPSEMVFRP